MIPFNKPYLSGKELDYIRQAVESGHISGNGFFTRKCEELLEKKYRLRKALLTTSCTHALEMAALLLDIKPGDEVIMPSFAYVSAANAFVLRGAQLVFADSNPTNPNLDVTKLEGLVTKKTKAILVLHYGGVGCAMEEVMSFAEKHKLFVVEDAAHCIDSFYKNRPLGTFGHLAAFSFHETKNIISGEGGMLVVNDEKFLKRAEMIREKGTNRPAFNRKEVNKYEWVDVGSSYMPSELTAAFLYAQLENISTIQNKRKNLWKKYYSDLSSLTAKGVQLPSGVVDEENNAHIFYLVCRSKEERENLIKHLAIRGVLAVFHYQALHLSPYFSHLHPNQQALPQSERYSECLLRLPLYYELYPSQIKEISGYITNFFA